MQRVQAGRRFAIPRSPPLPRWITWSTSQWPSRFGAHPRFSNSSGSPQKWQWPRVRSKTCRSWFSVNLCASSNLASPNGPSGERRAQRARSTGGLCAITLISMSGQHRCVHSVGDMQKVTLKVGYPAHDIVELLLISNMKTECCDGDCLGDG